MSAKADYTDLRSASPLVRINAFSFILNGTGAISTAHPTSLKGHECILPGGSIVYSTTGTYTVTLAYGRWYKYVIDIRASLDDTVSDGAYCTTGSITNEGTVNAPLSFTLFTRANASAALTNYTARRCFVSVWGHD